MKEKIIRANNINLYTQSFGKIEDPTIILIAGATVSMLFWDQEFCEKLANKHHHVIRFDFRDTGKSTSYQPGSSNYNIDDLVEDVIQIIEAYELDSAHLLGISLGGMIAQILAIKYPEKVRTLALMSTMPWCIVDSKIPDMDTRVLEYHAKAENIDWNNEQKVIEYMLQGSRLMNGRKPFNKEKAESYLKESFRRAVNFRSQFNHASLEGGMDYYNKIEKIKTPALIIHGTDDIICHFNFAPILVQKLKAQNFLILEGTGHELHEDDWDQIIRALSGMISHFENK